MNPKVLISFNTAFLNLDSSFLIDENFSTPKNISNAVLKFIDLWFEIGCYQNIVPTQW